MKHYIPLLVLVLAFKACADPSNNDINSNSKKHQRITKDSGDNENLGFLSGKWISSDKNVHLIVKGSTISFTVEKRSPKFAELNGTTKKIKSSTLVIDYKENDKYRYFIYWVPHEPDALTLLRKDWSTDRIIELEFSKN
jgi:hypothetical protein